MSLVSVNAVPFRPMRVDSALALLQVYQGEDAVPVYTVEAGKFLSSFFGLLTLGLLAFGFLPLGLLLSRLESASGFTHIDVQEVCMAVAEEIRDGKLGKVAMPLRAALTGTTVSPSITTSFRSTPRKVRPGVLTWTSSRYVPRSMRIRSPGAAPSTADWMVG